MSVSTLQIFEELRIISWALREIDTEEVTDEDLADIIPALDQITLALRKIVGGKREQARRITIYTPYHLRRSDVYAS